MLQQHFHIIVLTSKSMLCRIPMWDVLSPSYIRMFLSRQTCQTLTDSPMCSPLNQRAPRLFWLKMKSTWAIISLGIGAGMSILFLCINHILHVKSHEKNKWLNDSESCWQRMHPCLCVCISNMDNLSSVRSLPLNALYILSCILFARPFNHIKLACCIGGCIGLIWLKATWNSNFPELVRSQWLASAAVDWSIAITAISSASSRPTDSCQVPLFIRLLTNILNFPQHRKRLPANSFHYTLMFQPWIKPHVSLRSASKDPSNQWPNLHLMPKDKLTDDRLIIIETSNPEIMRLLHPLSP